LQCPSEALRAFFAEPDLDVFSVFGQTGAPTKRGRLQATERRTVARHFLACESLFMACYEIHAAQHDNLGPINNIRLLNSESRI